MIKTLLTKSNFVVAIVFFIFLSQSAHAQLSDFTLNVAVTDETCTGNGALTFSTQNTTPGATIIYSVYLLPDTTTPIAVLSGTTITGLSAGNYMVVALQTLGDQSNSQQQNVTVTSQIVPLTFTVAGTPESCGNGVITVTAEGNAAFYELISGPDIVPPQTSNVFTGLTAGTYNVRVIDACGDGHVQTFTLETIGYLTASDIQMQCNRETCGVLDSYFTITTNIIEQPEQYIIYPLVVTITVHPPGGGAPIVFTQTITSGNGDPNFMTVNQQIPFYNGQAYSYDISVADSCGHVFTNNNNVIDEQLTLDVDTLPGPPSSISLTPCNGVPPYTVTFTSAPPGFNPSDFNSQHPGPFNSAPIVYMSNEEHELPEGDYEMVITDSCGNNASGEATIVLCPITMEIVPTCPKLGTVISPVGPGTPLATGFIVEAPPGFTEPLPFDLAPYINEFGVLTITLPPGHYVIEGMSTCPRPYTLNFTIVEPFIEAEGKNVFGCSPTTGSIDIEFKEGTFMTSIVIEQAPVGFPNPLPLDVSGFLEGAQPTLCTITGLMSGDYVLTVTDACGNVYTVNVNVPLLLYDGLPTVTSLPGCAIGYGAITMSTLNGGFSQITILAAPAAYSSPLPHDVSFGINSIMALCLADLPEGTYTFKTIDICGVEKIFDFTFTGFHIISNDITVRGNCGSFDLDVQYSPTNPYGQTFWLQKYDPVAGVWEHPFTGVNFTGTISPANSYQLLNNAVNYNLATLGQFRIIRGNLVYTTGSVLWTICTEVIKEFTFTGALEIRSAYSMPCVNGVSQVLIIAGDTFPLQYRITEKDSQPFVVENGESNTFAGLTPGIYNFQVTDQCGNIANRLFDIVALSEPQITAHNLCDGQNGYLSVQGISYLNYQWWNAADPSTIISTTSSLYFSPFNQATTPGTYFVRIYSTSTLSCIDTTISYVIAPNSAPNAGQDANVTLCGGSAAIDLFTILGAPYDATGYWEELSGSGMLTGNMWLPVGLSAGTYEFRYHVNGFCTDFDEATVTIELKAAVSNPILNVEQIPCSGNEIRFTANAVVGANYLWSGPNNFTSTEQNPVIANSTLANTGVYTLTVKLNDCEASSIIDIKVLASPDFNLVQTCQNGAYVLKAEPVGGAFEPRVTYSWTGPNNFTASDNPVTITGLPSGSYELTVTTEDNCSVTKAMAVATTRCSIPSGISPNNDGDNDFLDLTGFDVLKFKIFNRYGRMVFEQDDYTNQWHGQDFNDRDLPDATYYYYIKLRTGEERTGWIYVNN